MFFKCIPMLNAIGFVLFGLFEESYEDVFAQKDDVSGKIIKTIKTASKTECLLRCRNLKSFATFNESTCNCISMVEDVSKYSIYKETG